MAEATIGRASSRSRIDRLLELDDGRRAGVALYGDPDGAPVFMFHGTPASRITFSFLHDRAAQRGVCIVAPDRPGIGLSDDLPNRGILDYPDDVAAIADALGHATFAVAGWSLGSAYALACADRLGDRVSSVAVVSGMGPLDAEGSLEGFGRTEREALRLTHVAPWLMKPFYRALCTAVRTRPDLALRAIRHSLGTGDRDQLGDDDPRKLTAFLVEACRQGPRGIVLDFRLYTFPWGFGLAGIDVPVHVFHGDDDKTIPARHAQLIADAIPGSTLTMWPGEGHLGFWRHADAVLDAIT